MSSLGSRSYNAARLLTEARRAACGAAAVLVLCLGAGTARAVERQDGPPPWRVGGRTGFTCDAASFPDSVGYHLEVYLRIPPATLRQLSLDEQGDAHIRASVKLHQRNVPKDLESSQEFAISMADTVRGQGRVLLLSFPVVPGSCRVSARLEDLLSHKRRLATSTRGLTEATEVRGNVDIPRAQAGRDLSDIEFVWPRPGRAPGVAFVRGGQAHVPNPDRLYGLYATTLEAAFTARAKGADERPWHWVMRVLDEKGQVVAQRESTSVAGVLAQGAAQFEVADLPAGEYSLDARVWQQGDAGSLQRRSRFSVGWEPDTWNRSPADIADEAHFLLDAEDEERFLMLQPGEQERMLGEFWRKRDPSPETAANEARDLFLERVEHANSQYSQFGIGRGMFSDMGRVYIRYGAPTEILHQVMPAGEETLTKALQDIIMSEDRVMGEVNQKGPGADQRPYEVWLYQGDIPMPFDADPAAPLSRGNKRRLLFLFVDEQGLGTYTLRYSTE